MRSITRTTRETADILMRAISPVGYLWPWIFSAVVFNAFLESPQGIGLLLEDASEHTSKAVRIFSSTAVFFLTMIACILTTVAANGSRLASRGIGWRSQVGGADILFNLAWAIMIAYFSTPIGPTSNFILAGTLLLVSLVGVVLNIFRRGALIILTLYAWAGGLPRPLNWMAIIGWTLLLLYLLPAIVIIVPVALWLAWDYNAILFWVGALAITLLWWPALKWASAALETSKTIIVLVERAYQWRTILLVVVTFLAAAPLLIGAWIIVDHPYIVDSLGAIQITMIGLSAIACIVGGIFVAIPACFHRPGLGFLGLIPIVFSLGNTPIANDDSNKLIADRKSAAEKSLSQRRCASPIDELHAPLRQMDRDVPSGQLAVPTAYVISASGGGIRAAYWTALGLSQLSLATDDQLGSSVAAMSGVSGGSLGIATWLASRELVDKSPLERQELIKSFLGGDFLTPAIGGLLFLDVPRFLLGGIWLKPERGHIFERSIAERWRRLTGSDFFYRPLKGLCMEGTQQSSAIIFNTTDALSGSSFPLTNLSHSHLERHMSLSVVEAVHTSARFPFLSSSKETRISYYKDPTESNNQNPIIRGRALVDGGYYDNTGIMSIRDVLQGLENQRIKDPHPLVHDSRIRVKHIHFTNDAINDLNGECQQVSRDELRELERRVSSSDWSAIGRSIECTSDIDQVLRGMRSKPFQWLLTPVEAMLAVRDTRARETREATFGKDTINQDFLVISLARELSTYTRELKHESSKRTEPKALSNDEAIKHAMNERKMGATFFIAQLKSAEVESRRLHPDDEKTKEFYSGLDPWLARVNAWHAAASRESLPGTCHFLYENARLPLGWKLSANDQWAMDCATLRAQSRAALALFPDFDFDQFPKDIAIPYIPGWLRTSNEPHKGNMSEPVPSWAETIPTLLSTKQPNGAIERSPTTGR